MGRPSKFSEKKWDEILKRVPPLGKESVRSVAAELKITEGAIRARVNTQSKPIISLANQIVDVERKFEALPLNTQVKVRTLADTLKDISEHLGHAARYGSRTAHRLNSLAYSEVQKVDDVNPLDSIESLKGVSALTRLANDSAEIGLNLLKANKEAIDNLNKSDDKPEPKQIVFSVTDARA
jgi:hypothetical protein